MRVLVTGATGFVGPHLVRRLMALGHEVCAFGLPPRGDDPLRALGVELVYGEITDQPLLDRLVRDRETVFHLAAIGKEAGYPERAYRRINVDGTDLLCKAALRHGVRRLVHTSTAWVLGPARNGPLTEEHPYAPEGIYEITRMQGEQAALRHQGALEVVVIRPTSIYGPGDLRLLNLFRLVKRRIFLGRGRNRYHLVYVSDLVEGFVRAAGAAYAAGRAYIIGGERSVPLRDLVEAAARTLGTGPPLVHIPAMPLYAVGYLFEKAFEPLGIQPPLYRRRVDFFVKDRAFSIERARRELGYEPQVDLATGVRLTGEWYRAHGLI